MKIKTFFSKIAFIIDKKKLVKYTENFPFVLDNQ